MESKSVWKVVYGTSQDYSTFYVLADSFDEAVEKYEKIYVGEEHYGYQTTKNQLMSIERLGFAYY